MKINIPKIVRSLQLADFDPAYEQSEIWVWVNPPRVKVQEYYQLLNQALEAQKELTQLARAGPEADEGAQAEALRAIDRAGDQMMAWMAEVWSQGADPESRWSKEEVAQLLESSLDLAPGLWPWLTGRTRQMILDYRAEAKKA